MARLEEAAADLQVRAAGLSVELNESRRRVEALRLAILDGEGQLDLDIQALDGLRTDVHAADDGVAALRLKADDQEAAIKLARGALEAIRAIVADLDIARATAEADLTHLADRAWRRCSPPSTRWSRKWISSSATAR